MPSRYIVKYTQSKYKDTLKIGTLWSYRDLVGGQTDHHDGLLALKNGSPTVPASGVDYISYLDIANCYLVCLSVQDDLQPDPQLLARFEADIVLPVGLVDGDVENVRAKPSPVMHGKDGEIPFCAVPSNDPSVKPDEVFVSAQLGDSLALSFCQEIYTQIERSSGFPIRQSKPKDRYLIRHTCRYITYLAPETPLQFPDNNPESLAQAIVFTKEESFTVEREYRIMLRLFDKILNRYVSVNYEPIIIPIDVIQNPSAKFFV